MKWKNRVTALLFFFALIFSILPGCAKEDETPTKSAAAIEVEQLISAIGTVSLDREAAITSAESAFDRLDIEAQNEVENLELLVEARSELDRLKKEAYEQDKQELIDLMGTMQNSVLFVVACEYQITTNVGGSDFYKYLTLVQYFDEDKPYSQYKAPAEGADLSIWLWGAGYALSRDHINGGEVKSGHENEIIHDCYLFNAEYARVDQVKKLERMADAFFAKYGTEGEDEKNLRGWYTVLVDCANLIVSPNGNGNTLLSRVLDYSKQAEVYFKALGVDIDSYKANYN